MQKQRSLARWLGFRRLSNHPRWIPPRPRKCLLMELKQSGSRGKNSFENPERNNFWILHKTELLYNKQRSRVQSLITGLQSVSKLKVPELHIFSDSKLVVNQVTRKFEAQGTKIAKYLAVAKNLLTEFRAIKIEQVGRDLNSHADALVGVA